MYFTVKKGQEAVAVVSKKPPVVIGRDKSCDIVLEDRRGSRRHTRIFEEKGRLLVEDLASTNGTWLNGEKISSPAEIRPGDIITIGSHNLTLSEEEPPRAPVVKDVPTGDLRTLMIEPEAALNVPANLSRAYERLLAIYRLAKRAGSARSIPQLFTETAETAEEVLETDRVCPVLYEKGGWRPLAPGRSKRGALAKTLENLPISQGILDAAAKSLKPVIMARRKGEKFRDRRSIQELDISTALAVPLAVGKKLLGVVYADRVSDAPEFSDEDLEWLASAAGIVSGALYALVNQQELSARAKSLQDMLAGDINMIGQSEALGKVRRLINAAARVDSPVLITGESGTGKELVARLIHFEGSRAGGPFVVLNCAALPESLAESELFGHVRGAFTGAVDDRPGRFEAAAGGTIFLDEVAELPLAMQVKLLRVLEGGEFQRVGGTSVQHTDARMLCATNRDIDTMVRDGLFREDLFFRLNVLRVAVPPLREREEDLKHLLDYYMEFYAERMGRRKPEVDKAALDALLAHKWPGNVRELKNAVERLMVLVPSGKITPAEIALVLS